MASWLDTAPDEDTNYIVVLTNLRDRDKDAAFMFDVGTPTDVITDSIRLDKTAGKFLKWNGTIWVDAFTELDMSVSTLDGVLAANYARTDIAETFAGDVTISNAPAVFILDGSGVTDSVVRLRNDSVDRGSLIWDDSLSEVQLLAHNTGGTVINSIELTQTAGLVEILGNEVWHAGNDGSASGLDAGLLEGNDAAFYQNADNLNAGDIPAARIEINAITSVKISSGAVTTAKIADANVTGVKLASLAASTAKIAANAVTLAKFARTGTTGQVLTSQGTGADAIYTTLTTIGDFESQLLHVQDQKASGTNGGTFTAGSFQTRDLNTILTNEISGATLVSNQISLPAGTYYIHANGPAQTVNLHKTKLRNITDSSDILIGTSDKAETDTASTRSIITGRFTLAATKTLEFQHRCLVTRNTDGFGQACSFGVTEIYSDAMIWKVG